MDLTRQRPAPTPVKPGVPRSWCASHHARFAALLDLKPLAVGDALLEAILKDVRVMTYCGLNFLTGQKANEAQLMAALDHFSPVCCFLGDDVMERLYNELAFGHGQPGRPVLEVLK